MYTCALGDMDLASRTVRMEKKRNLKAVLEASPNVVVSKLRVTS